MKMKAPAEAVGKKVKCKGCCHAFVIQNEAATQAVKAPAKAPAKPAAKGAPQKAAPTPAKKPDDDDEGSDPYGVTEMQLGARCPHCANEIEEGQRVCLHCGYDNESRQQARTRKVVYVTGFDQFLWLLPGIACVIFIIGAIVFDVIYCLNAEEWFGDDKWYSFLGGQGVKMWMVIISLFMMAAALSFAIKRLYYHPHPPEVETH
jgi:uncharacterized membrane protein YagU involved in acid resistance